MVVATREQSTSRQFTSAIEREAVQSYAELVWRVPESGAVYGYLEDGVLHALVLGRFLSSAQLRTLFRAQEEIKSRFPQIEWSFHILDQKDSTLAAPIPADAILVRIDRPQSSN